MAEAASTISRDELDRTWGSQRCRSSTTRSNDKNSHGSSLLREPGLVCPGEAASGVAAVGESAVVGSSAAVGNLAADAPVVVDTSPPLPYPRKRARSSRVTNDAPSAWEPPRSMPSTRGPRRLPSFVPDRLNQSWPLPSGASAADAIDVDSLPTERVSPPAGGVGRSLLEPCQAGDAATSDEEYARLLQREFEELEQRAELEKKRQEEEDRRMAAQLFRQLQADAAGEGPVRGSMDGNSGQRAASDDPSVRERPNRWDTRRRHGLEGAEHDDGHGGEDAGHAWWGALGGGAGVGVGGEVEGRAEGGGGRRDSGGRAVAGGYRCGAVGRVDDDELEHRLAREDAADSTDRRRRPYRPSYHSMRYEGGHHHHRHEGSQGGRYADASRAALGSRGGPRRRGDPGGDISEAIAGGALDGGPPFMPFPFAPSGWHGRRGHSIRAEVLAAFMANRALDSGNYEALLQLGEALGSSRSNGASVAQINVLPTSTVLAHEVDKQQECVICLDTPVVGSVVRRLPCLHVFHAACVDQWLGRQGLCPVCKQKIAA